MSKIKQLIQFNDKSGVLKNLSELLEEVRDGNTKGIFLAFVRKDDSARTFWWGDSIAELNLLLDQMKNDFINNRFEDSNSESYTED